MARSFADRSQLIAYRRRARQRLQSRAPVGHSKIQAFIAGIQRSGLAAPFVMNWHTFEASF